MAQKEEEKAAENSSKDSAKTSQSQSVSKRSLKALKTGWQQEFEALNASDRQAMLFNLMNDRVYWRLIDLIRRSPERLTSSRQTYSDRCIGGEELCSYMGFRQPEGYSELWLKEHHVPTQIEARGHLDLLQAQIDALLELNPDIPICCIQRNFALAPLELEILATLVAFSSIETLLRLATVAWADFSVRQPTVTFICRLLSDEKHGGNEVYEAFSERGTLRRMRLVIAEKTQSFPNYTPRAYAALSVEQSVIDAFMGTHHPDDLPVDMLLHSSGLNRRALIVDPSVREEIEYLMKSRSMRLMLIGPQHAGRRTVICSMARRKNVLEVDVCHALEQSENISIDAKIAQIMREALINDAILMLRFDGIENREQLLGRFGESVAAISRLAGVYPGEIVILATHSNSIIEMAFEHLATVRIVNPPFEQACEIWKRALSASVESEELEHMSTMFSRNYSLPIGSIFSVVRDALEEVQAVGGEYLKSHHILNQIRKSFRHQLGTLAEITVSDVPLSGVVLPVQARSQVDEILEYANNLHNVLETWGFKERSPYGNALSILFSGPPGTGKTLLACALANELGKVLYRVDLSRIVDKYIGETEKNLAKIFDEAAKAQAIILFDEADSLFAKRTEVKSSNDRYANLEINFLLQKLESYNGVTILTTNLSKSIDEAFRRRIRFIIDFPMPDMPSRIALWKRMIPPNAPIADDIHWNWLARTFEMSGGYIRNAVLKASIAASAMHSPITMDHLVKAASAEARSMGKLMRIEDDEDYEYYDDDDGGYRE
ncbi:MAG: ATP-binding protein [Proteobacteria bacterium]|nr:ATP-binding protein [Pseudomonadota bacterium]